jgi:hypothetical protein
VNYAKDCSPEKQAFCCGFVAVGRAEKSKKWGQKDKYLSFFFFHFSYRFWVSDTTPNYRAESVKTLAIQRF